ncbi:signal peptidase I [Ruminococcaceae bacterium OttesenSCG-928-D13]|nr:signal peptidase I [Ruminococcaceae bacterium OttesenSCG-928-D13]
MKVPYHYRAPDVRDEDDEFEDRPPLIVRFLKGASFYIIVALVFLFINLVVVRLGVVNGSSMEPTLHDRDLVVIWQLFYQPEVGDIVVTNDENELAISLTKRVIATGGQQVVIEDGQLFVDGELRTEPYLLESAWGGVSLNVMVPDGQLFLMGDNRNGSYDSRNLGSIPEDDLMGRVVARIWPLSGIRGFGRE